MRFELSLVKLFYSVYHENLISVKKAFELFVLFSHNIARSPKFVIFYKKLPRKAASNKLNRSQGFWWAGTDVVEYYSVNRRWKDRTRVDLRGVEEDNSQEA